MRRDPGEPGTKRLWDDKHLIKHGRKGQKGSKDKKESSDLLEDPALADDVLGTDGPAVLGLLGVPLWAGVGTGFGAIADDRSRG